MKLDSTDRAYLSKIGATGWPPYDILWEEDEERAHDRRMARLTDAGLVRDDRTVAEDGFTETGSYVLTDAGRKALGRR
jgi:hypothetical protein